MDWEVRAVPDTTSMPSTPWLASPCIPNRPPTTTSSPTNRSAEHAGVADSRVRHMRRSLATGISSGPARASSSSLTGCYGASATAKLSSSTYDPSSSTPAGACPGPSTHWSRNSADRRRTPAQPPGHRLCRGQYCVLAYEALRLLNERGLPGRACHRRRPTATDRAASRTRWGLLTCRGHTADTSGPTGPARSSAAST